MRPLRLTAHDHPRRPKGTRKEAARLRSAGVGMLGRLRADLAREVRKDDALPRDLDARVFGYLDTLDAMHAAKAAPAAAPATPPAPDAKQSRSWEWRRYGNRSGGLTP